ncbi:MAG TPA: cupin domain-containing protein [Verrucomicrobiae bacterium]|nr:cupin domain-containing protein [Verrucomicrobiae bacterium]
MSDLAVSTPFLAAGAEPALEDWGPLTEATGEPMQTCGHTLWSDGTGDESGIWECSPGPSRWTLETNEFVHILAGRMTVTPDGGSPIEFAAGSTGIFPRGWTGTWDVHETVRKLYVIF